MISEKELKHHRLQAWLREHKCDDIEYLGKKGEDWWYRIGPHEITSDQFEDIEFAGEVDPDEIR
tara:strand:- start:1519 stop:1710 length:192 start_codon:yes stop_codon:yes gene_type:complete